MKYFFCTVCYITIKSVFFEMTVKVNMLLNDDLTCLRSEVIGKPLTTGMKMCRGWENTTLWVF